MTSADQAHRKILDAPLDIRLALTFSPAGSRPALTALFALYLEIREIPIECRDPGVSGVKLSWWEEELDRLLAGRARHPISQALAFQLPLLIGTRPVFQDLIDGTRMDVTGPALATYEDLKRYCYRHSGALAELAARLGGARQDDTLRAARMLGNARRLADIVNDGIGHALHGRVYFAAEDLRKHGVDRHIHDGAHSDAGVHALLEDYSGRARRMHSEAQMILPKADRPPLVPWQVLSALALKRVEKLEKRDFRLGQEPVELHPFSAVFTAWRAARQAR